MAEFANVLAKCYRNGSLYQDWAAPSSGLVMIAGYSWASSNYVMCLQISIPTPAKSITLSFCNGNDSMTKDKTLRYKFTAVEDAAMVNATSNIAGDGSFVVNKGNKVRTTVTIDRELSAGTHYMYIWTDNSSVTYNVLYTRWEDNSLGEGFYGFYEEGGGVTWIRTAPGSDPAPCDSYIQTESGPVVYDPYIFDGANWNILG